MTERTEHVRNVFAWLNQVLADHDLTGFVVAYVVAQHINHNSGEGHPSYRRIAQKTGLSKVTIIAAVDRLEANGHLAIERGQQGRGHSNHYRMIIKGSAAVPFSHEKGSAVVPFVGPIKGTDDSTQKGSVGERKGTVDSTEKVQPLNLNNLREQLKEQGGRAREQGRAERDSERASAPP
jgi:DNA-binding transcriptional MocR family regulator